MTVPTVYPSCCMAKEPGIHGLKHDDYPIPYTRGQGPKSNDPSFHSDNSVHCWSATGSIALVGLRSDVSYPKDWS